VCVCVCVCVEVGGWKIMCSSKRKYAKNKHGKSKIDYIENQLFEFYFDDHLFL